MSEDRSVAESLAPEPARATGQSASGPSQPPGPRPPCRSVPLRLPQSLTPSTPWPRISPPPSTPRRPPDPSTPNTPTRTTPSTGGGSTCGEAVGPTRRSGAQGQALRLGRLRSSRPPPPPNNAAKVANAAVGGRGGARTRS